MMNVSLCQKMTFKVVTASLFSVLFAVVAQAGTVLHLQSGNFTAQKLEKQSQQVFALETKKADYIVQFKDVVTEAIKEKLSQNNVEVFRYLPEDALIVRATHEQLENLRATLNINAIVPYKGGYKIGSNVPTLSIFSQMQKDVILITVFKNSDLDLVAAQVKLLDSQARILVKEERSVVIQSELSHIPAISNMTGVEFVQKVEPMVSMHFNLDDSSAGSVATAAGDYTDLLGGETGTQLMNFQSAWDQGYYGDGQVAAMADTGLDSGNASTVAPDFQDAIQGSGYIYGAGAKDWSDPMGHGTHVAGSVVSRGVSSGGKIHGGAYGAKIVPQGMWSPIIDNLTVPPQLGKMFSAAYADGARIHTNSWGAAANFGAYDAMAQKVDEFMWANPDMLVLFAAGNSGVDKDSNGVIDPGSVSSPGTSKNTLTVGAAKNVEAKGGIQRKVSELRGAKDNWPAEPISSSKLSETSAGIAMFSSRGPAKDGRLKPEIVAPGTNILSNKSQVKDASPLWGEYNSLYAWAGGTSMATPLTAGAATVTREILMKKYGIVKPSAALIKATLMHTAKNLYPGQFGSGQFQEIAAHPDSNQGFGRVDMKTLVEMDHSILIDNNTGVATGEVFEKIVNVKNGELVVNMVYTDAPGAPSAGAALVNNLDLVVTSPDGKVVSQSDAINNNEFYEGHGIKNGTYKIQVKGANVPMGKAGKQPFALVYTAE